MAGERPPEVPAPDAGGRRHVSGDRARTGAMIVLVIVATLFAVLNVGDVEVDWILGSGKAPLIIVIVVSLLVGIVLTHFAERRRR